LIDSLSIALLGLEPSCYYNTVGSERSSIRFVSYAFLCLLILSLIATYLIGLFVSGYHISAFIISILGSFILISIFRFSLILIKPEIKLIKQFNEVIIQTSWKTKLQSFRSLLKSKKLSFNNFKWNSNRAIPGFTFVFRTIYLMLLALIIIFPLTVLSNFKDATSYNNELRLKALSIYRTTEINFLNQTKLEESKNDFNKRISWYENKVNHEYFTMKIFTRAMNYSSFNGIAISIMILFFLPHLLLFRLMRNPNYTYVPSLKNHFQSLITEDFNHLNNDVKQILKNKGYTINEIDLKFLNKNNPFIEKETEIPSVENVSWDTWQNKQTVINNEPIA
jgi:hypothetical protein